MKKSILLLIMLITGCLSIRDNNKLHLDDSHYHSCIRFITDTTDTKYISNCEVSGEYVKVYYIYQDRYKYGEDSIKIMTDSALRVYIIDKYKHMEIGPVIRTMSAQQYIDTLKTFKYDYKTINDTAVIFKERIWDKRVLQKMYNKYILNNTSNMYN